LTDAEIQALGLDYVQRGPVAIMWKGNVYTKRSDAIILKKGMAVKISAKIDEATETVVDAEFLLKVDSVTPQPLRTGAGLGNYVCPGEILR